MTAMNTYKRVSVDDRDDDPMGETISVSQSSTGKDKLTWATIIICVFCTVVNILCVAYTSGFRPYSFPSATSFLTSRGVSRQDIDSLRRPSQFIGLDKIHRNQTAPEDVKSFINFPTLMAQVDTANPRKVTTLRMGVYTEIGTVYPQLSDMVVTSSVSTIIQFRALDFGMELCELTIIIPDAEDATSVALSNTVDVYAIDQKKPLYGDSLSHRNRPGRGELLNQVFLKLGVNWSHTFKCAMDEIYTFEVACSSLNKDGCNLKWTQDKEHDSFPAILMAQHSTV